MPSFTWKGKNRTGQVQEGVLTADNRDAAIAALKRQQIQVSSVKKQGGEIKLMPRMPRRVSQKDLAVFTRQFSVMLDAGLPLVQCLEILGNSGENKAFSEIITGVRGEVEQGLSLADAMKKYPKAFDNLYVNMIAAGEAGGILDVILQRLSTYIEKVVKLRNQVQSAMMYPVAIIVIASGVVFIILWKVIPVFASMFSGLGGELPFLTRMVIGASNFLGRYAIWMFLAIGGIIFGIKQWRTTDSGRKITDTLLLKVPVIGMLLLKIAVARFCRTLATLTSSGVPILDGLEITAKTSGNKVVEDAIMGVRKQVEEGKTISDPLAESGIFPPMVCQMINVGEQTGALDAMLSKIADFYEDEVDTAVDGLMKLLEPIMITVLGGVIGTIVTAMYMPMYSILQKIG